jgi:tRNA uridine 5-carbamoylmethylation protein Kti12
MRFEKHRLNEEENDILLTEGIEDVGIFKAVFLAGIAGAGKSYVASKVRSGLIEPRVVNTDTWVEYFGNDYNSFYDTSKKLVKKQLALYVNSMLPLICDQTSTNFNTVLRRQHILERMGYDTSMIFVNTSLDVAIERASKRERQVPKDEVVKYYERMTKIKPHLKSKFGIYMEIKNDDGELTDEIIQKAFKRMMFFYTAPVENPLGQQAIEIMKKNGWKYLSPNIHTMDDIKTYTDRWYSKE